MTDFTDIPYSELCNTDPQKIIDMIRAGIPANRIPRLADRLGVQPDLVVDALGFSRKTIHHKLATGARLSIDETERVLGMESLIDYVQGMVDKGYNPERFDVPRWMGEWMFRKVPALAFATPASYMDTFEGQRLITGLLGAMESGAYV